MPFLILLGLAAAGLLFYSRSAHGAAPPPAGVTPGQDADIQKTVATALATEKDPNVLLKLGSALRQAGYPALADIVEAKAHQIAALIPGAVFNPATGGAPPPVMAMATQSLAMAAPQLQAQGASIHAPRYVTSGDYQEGTSHNMMRLPSRHMMYLPGYRGGSWELR